MASAFDDFVTKTNAAFEQVNLNLVNIAADEASLNQQIADLKAQLTAGGILTQAQLDTLAAIAGKAEAMATTTKAMADSVPELPAPPPPPPPPPTV